MVVWYDISIVNNERGLKNMKAITKGLIDTLINFIYLTCIFIGYLGVIGWRADIVAGCLIVVLVGSLIKQALKLGTYM